MFKYDNSLAVMRAQPFHNGHSLVIDEMLKASNAVIVVIGSAELSGIENNPYSYDFRKKCIELTYPKEVAQDKLKIIGISNIYNPKNWSNQVISTVQNAFDVIPDVYFCGSKDNGKFFMSKGLDVVDILREKNEFISGTEVRKLIKSRNYPVLKKQLPKGTLEMLNIDMNI